MPKRRTRSREPWYPPPSTPRPVEGGIRARSQRGRIGATWWSRRFLDLLESLGLGGRLDRGKRYARQGQVLSLDVEGGEVTALVQGSRARPYRVRIGVTELNEAQWRQVEAALTERALFAATLLAGEMPRDIEDVFEACDLSLFPDKLAELRSTCSCPDGSNPCKHLAAVYYLLGEAFDEDPFLVLRWRGRDRQQLLDNLRALRGGGTEPVSAAREDPWAAIEDLARPAVAGAGGPYWEGEAEGDIATVPRPTQRSAAGGGGILRELDPLDRHVAGRSLVELLGPAYATLTATARERLLAEAGSEPR